MHRFAAFLFALAASAPSFARAEIHYYLVDTIAAQSTNADWRAQAHELEKIYADMARQSGVEAKLIYSTNPDINAFATEVGADKIVVVQEGLLEQMNGDRDAVAAVLGHELAHHKADHIRAGKRKAEGARVLGTILGAVVGAKIGHGGGAAAGAILGNAGGGLVALKFNRDQEMEADRLSVGWMIAAGYNPQGMLRLQRHLSELEGKHKGAAIFSTHPTSEKRYKAAGQQIAKFAPPPELLAHPVEPLVCDGALVAARTEIKGVQDARIAAALKPESGEVTAAALAPVDKLGFDTYAALQNQMLYAGDKGEARLLAKNHLNEAQLHRASATFMQRMHENPALAQHYRAEYFRATQGKLAAYGRDLADSYEKGQALQLEPPYSLETAAVLFAEMRKRGAPSLDAAQQAAAETEVLKAHGLSYYDFLIAHNWWARKASIAAVTGDTSITQRYYGLAADAAEEDDAQAETETADVHVGSNVQVGKNVRAGGHELKSAKPGGN